MQPVIITENAAKKIMEKISLNPEAVGLRLTIASTGCSGHSYKMEYAFSEDAEKDDRFESNGAVLFIPKIHSWMLFGMTIDYEETPLKSGFVFSNPNEVGRCGCGESFTVERMK